MASKRIIVSVINDLATDNRVRRVCDFLHRHGFEVILVGRKLPNSLPINDRPYKTKRFWLPFTKGALFYATYNIRLLIYLLFKRSDLLLANDLDTLLANTWALKFKPNCKLIYDSHEYFTGVPELVNRPKVQKIWTRIEQKCMPKIHRMYTVNESIAQLYKEQYKIHVDVVRNISEIPANFKPKNRQELGLPADKRIVILQGAGINIQRGAEEMIEAIQHVRNAVLLFVGGGDVMDQLKEIVKKNKWEHTVIFIGKVPYHELLSYTSNADIGVSMDKDTNINYRFSLPNKLFDYLHCHIPVIVSDLPEIKKIVEKYDVGVVCKSHDPSEISNTLNTLFSDTQRYQHIRENTKRASAELTWEAECKVLEKIYL